MQYLHFLRRKKLARPQNNIIWDEEIQTPVVSMYIGGVWPFSFLIIRSDSRASAQTTVSRYIIHGMHSWVSSFEMILTRVFDGRW